MKAGTNQKPEKVAKDFLLNRTGAAASPLDSAAQAEAPASAQVGPPDGRNLAMVRALYEKEARPVGTMPPPLTAKGVVQAAGGLVKGTNPMALIDKLAERCAFERSGVRLYQGLVAKFDARGGFDGGPTREELLEFQEEELQHFQLLSTALAMVGADATAMTPSADVVAVATMGIVHVISDPRTTLPQALSAMLITELTDNDAWDMLIDITEQIGPKELVAKFRAAKREEDEHLVAVRSWLKAYGKIVAHRGDAEA